MPVKTLPQAQNVDDKIILVGVHVNRYPLSVLLQNESYGDMERKKLSGGSLIQQPPRYTCATVAPD